MTGEGLRPALLIRFGSGSEARRPIRPGRQVVGRSPSVDVTIPSQWVSSRHAEIQWDGRRLSVRDLGSRNGTSVNGSPVTDWVDLHDGDAITFADVDGEVEFAAPGSAVEWRGDPAPAPHPVPDDSPTGPWARPTAVPIFVSHSSEDKAAARVVAGHLRRRGWKVWIDESGIRGGTDWRGELVQALEGTWVVVLLVSLRSMRSKWVVREVEAADRLGKTIIPVVIDEAPYPDTLRMVLGGIQQVDLTRWSDDEYAGAQLARLEEALFVVARSGGRTPPGTSQIAIGRVVGVIGMVGFFAGFVLFVWLGIQAVTGDHSFPEGIPPPFYGLGVCMVSIIVAGIGEGVRRSGLRKGI